MADALEGRCLCGEISYVATADPLLMLKCHCRDCQRVTGSAYAAVVVFPKEAVRIQGELRFHEVLGDAGDPIQRGFCPSCGSRIASTMSRIPTIMNIMAGSLADPSLFRPTVEIFTASARGWDRMDPDTRKFSANLTR